jgi:dihydroorotate dehydrogenase electron transfer subunit
MNKIYEIKTPLTVNKEISTNIYSLKFKSLKITERASPGKFVHIRLNNNTSFILRRPFSIASVKSEEIEIIYQVVGEGTEYLAQKKPGEFLQVMGPLGNGFNCDEKGFSLVVGGGMGMAPLKYLSLYLARENREFMILYGAKKADEIFILNELEKHGKEIKYYTEDGSFGEKGTVVKDIEKLISSYKPKVIYTCGPDAMLKKIVSISKQFRIFTQVSKEERMGCGIGACLCCVCQTNEGYKKVCHDGPVFPSKFFE